MVVSAFTQGTRSWLAKFGIQAPDIRIEGLTLDSREVAPKCAFIAIPGHQRDGRSFIPQAISLGAKVILQHTDSLDQHGAIEMRDHSVLISVFDLAARVSSLAAAFYDYPSLKLKTTAVTGTNGKTSVVQLIGQLQSALSVKSASIGTIGSGIYDPKKQSWRLAETTNTTPDGIKFQHLLADFVQQEVGHVAFEASSHALVQGRMAQVSTDVAIFTNLTRDHLDYHGTMEAYASAKRRLLNQVGLQAVVLNQDDSESLNWRKHTPDEVKVVWTSLSTIKRPEPQDCHCFATSVQYDSDGCRFLLDSSWGQADVKVALLGEFNVANLLSAAASLLVQGTRLDDLVAAMEEIKPVMGRMEIYPFAQHANVIVDYAHTPDALEKALQAVSQHTDADVWCVFGCGGDRDKGKRPLMGEVAEKFADHVVITTDNSRSELPDLIVADILAGTQEPTKITIEPDREAAIRLCLKNAKPNDLILVAGKGHEDYQILLGEKKNYNERAVVSRLQGEFAQ